MINPATGSTISQEDMKAYLQQIEMTKNLLRKLNPDREEMFRFITR